MGRLTVSFLVAIFLVAALVQAQILEKGLLLGREALTCAGIYAGVMTVVAGIMS